MSTRVHRTAAGGFGVVSAVVLVAASAWACSPSASINACGTAATEGPPGTQTSICGSALERGAEIFWGSPSAGQRVATATGESFAIPVTVPSGAATGYGRFVAVYSYSGGSIVRSQSVGFLVTPGGAATAGQPALVPETEASSSAAEPGVTPAQPATVAKPATSPAAPTSAAAAAPVAGEPAALQIASPAPAGTRTLPVSASPSAVRAPSGRVVFGGSTAPAATPAAGAAQPAVIPDEGMPSAVPARAAAGDLWSGFQSGPSTDRSLGLNSSTGSGPASGTATGATLFLAGLAALFAGFGAAELGRRRAVVHAGDRTRLS